jgi:hypothetical protein
VFSVAFRQGHGRAAVIENVEVSRLGAAPTVAEVPDQSIGVLELSGGQQILQQLVICITGIGPHMHIGDLAIADFDYSRTLLHSLAVHLIGAQTPWRHQYVQRIAVFRSTDCQSHCMTGFADERRDRLEGGAVHGYQLIANRKLRGCRGKTIEHAGDEVPALDNASQHPDTDIGHFARPEMPRQVSPQAAREYVGKVIKGDFGRRVVAGVRDTQLPQHLINDLG